MFGSKRSSAKYPLATISAYGPDNTRATKLVVSILRRARQKYPSEMRTWRNDAGDVRNDPLIAAEVADWLHSQRIKDTLTRSVPFHRKPERVDRTVARSDEHVTRARPQTPAGQRGADRRAALPEGRPGRTVQRVERGRRVRRT
jgi:hypothetical protein